MGWLNSDYIKKFCLGKTIQSIEEVKQHFSTQICFTDGTSIKMYLNLISKGTSVLVKPTVGGTTVELITEIVVTPFDADGKAVQSLDIMGKNDGTE